MAEHCETRSLSQSFHPLLAHTTTYGIGSPGQKGLAVIRAMEDTADNIVQDDLVRAVIEELVSVPYK